VEKQGEEISHVVSEMHFVKRSAILWSSYGIGRFFSGKGDGDQKDVVVVDLAGSLELSFCC